jgi:hypothetical protein
VKITKMHALRRAVPHARRFSGMGRGDHHRTLEQAAARAGLTLQHTSVVELKALGKLREGLAPLLEDHTPEEIAAAMRLVDWAGLDGPHATSRHIPDEQSGATGSA